MRTLEAMRYLVRKDQYSLFVHGIVFSLLAEARQQGIDNSVAALFFYARDQITYVEDPPGLERVADFQRTMESGEGDCDDKVVWLATALINIGVPVRFVVQSYGRTWDHVYCEYYEWALWKWVALDPTADGHTGVIAGIGWRQSLAPAGYEMTFSV